MDCEDGMGKLDNLIFQDEEHDHGHHSHNVAPREHKDDLSLGVSKNIPECFQKKGAKSGQQVHVHVNLSLRFHDRLLYDSKSMLAPPVRWYRAMYCHWCVMGSGWASLELPW